MKNFLITVFPSSVAIIFFMGGLRILRLKLTIGLVRATNSSLILPIFSGLHVMYSSNLLLNFSKLLMSSGARQVVVLRLGDVCCFRKNVGLWLLVFVAVGDLLACTDGKPCCGILFRCVVGS